MSGHCVCELCSYFRADNGPIGFIPILFERLPKGTRFVKTLSGQVKYIAGNMTLFFPANANVNVI